MADRERFTVSIDPELSGKFAALAKRSGYTNRSKLVCDLIRGKLVDEDWEKDREALGTITLLYDHHQRRLLNALADIQHDHHEQVLCTCHVHLNHDLCAETIMVRGKAERIRAIVDRMRRLKGVLHATLSMSSTGAALA